VIINFRLILAREMLLSILTALDIIHGAGYVHRDLSPKNILIHSFSEDSVPRIVSQNSFYY
jgi:serine/threonine protein kinase